MDLREAKQILNKNGYVLEEGKLGRALTAGALALGLTAGNANAMDLNDIEEYETELEQETNNIIYLENSKNYLKIIDEEHVELVSSVKNVKWVYDTKLTKINLLTLLDLIKQNSNTFKSKNYDAVAKYLIKYGQKTKCIQYKNDEIVAVTFYKDDIPIKTVCADGTKLDGTEHYFKKDYSNDINCSK